MNPPINLIPWVHIDNIAPIVGIDRRHIAACILVESAGERFSARYETSYRYLYFPEKFAEDLKQSLDTETIQQKFSWGYMHIMGATARELGFKGYLPELSEPDLGVKYGCLYLKKQLEKYGGNIYDAIAAYNAGSVRKTSGGLYENQKHVDRFHKCLLTVQNIS